MKIKPRPSRARPAARGEALASTESGKAPARQPTPALSRAAVLLGLTITSTLQAHASAPQGEAFRETDAETVVVYLVRHAERVDDGTDDPPLALAGRIRAQLLRQLLSEARVTHVHTTDTKRTRDTARPFADKMGVDPSLYDPGDLAAFASRLRATPGHHLVVGHSNTTPMLVELLGGDPFGPIYELEYDRLYIVVIPRGQPPVTTILRFGEPYVEGRDFGLRTGADPRSCEPPR